MGSISSLPSPTTGTVGLTSGQGGMVVHVEQDGVVMRTGGVWEGGVEIVEGLLRRKDRWSLDDVLKSSWF
jgi:hypothetical protein